MSNDNTTANTDITLAAGTTATATANKPAANPNAVVEGQRVPGKVTQLLQGGFAVLVQIGGQNGPTGLLHKDAMDGGTHAGRKDNLAKLVKGSEVMVEVVRIRPSKGPDDNRGRDRYDLSIKTIQEADILDNVIPMSDDQPGTKLNCVFDRLNAEKGFALLKVTDGPAKGYLVLLHATDCPHRDDTLAELERNAGQNVTVEVKALERPPQEKDDLRIKVTLLGDARRSAQAALSDTTKVYQGKATRRAGDGMEISFGPIENPLTGILPGSKVPASLAIGGTVKVRIASTTGGRITLDRAKS